MLKKEYIYSAHNNINQSSNLVVILPEIWGITNFTKDLANLIQDKTNKDAIVLDFYAPLGLGPISLPYDEKGTELAYTYKADLTGEQFLSLWQNDFSQHIAEYYPKANNITVIGFCFGGRLAWLAGVDSKVNQIFSFYGAGPHEVYCYGLGSVDYLAKNRINKDLKCYGFYGALDTSIPEVDREKTKKILSNLYFYQDYIFPAKHAFMNANRANFDANSAQKATKILIDTIA